ncbi:MAG: hypothetical protein WAM14_21895 [Candidatus Nitrosopolaris sp.]
MVLDNDAKKGVEDYRKIHNHLIKDEKINELKNKIEKLRTYIHGWYLGGFPACDLCDPSKLSPV